ncbi:P-loop containing nucleoside triphosphate hydrolase protein [Phellopilus nigrolimitatus]|nr:P-loop containing nucleoside triphosphate hydrolase protein [Phellopilus nigrolimitatus]
MLWQPSACRRTLLSSQSFFRAIVYRASACSQTRRLASTPAKSNTKNEAEKIRNIAVVAHIDSGKTTLTESILSRSGYLSSPGTVDTGSTTTDFLPAERERGITIQSASIPVSWEKWSFNLVDTPGHADFGMEVESASRVVDGAVVLIDAVEGVESQTQGVWRQLDRYGVPSRILFLNKMDRTGASFLASMRSLLNYRLHAKPMAIMLPVASFDPQAYTSAEPGIQGIVDLVRWELWKWDEQDPRTGDGEAAFTQTPLPVQLEELEQSKLFPPDHPLLKELIPARMALLENLSTFSDDLLETLVGLPADPSAYLSVRAQNILPALRAATLRNEVLPVLCGSAMRHIGTDLVLDYAGLLLASPLDIPGAVTHEGSGDVQMLAWKVSWDKRRGWMTFVRIYSGTLTRQSTLLNVTRNQKEKVSKLLLLHASRPEEVDNLTFGSIGVILGLKHTRTGDTLISSTSPHTSRAAKTQQQNQAPSDPLRDITPPPAVMSASIIPQSNSDLQPVQDALLALARTDPSARIEVVDGQLLVHGLGALHLEIIEGRLRDEWGVAFEAGRRRVTYREAFPDVDEMRVDDRWNTELHGRSVGVHMTFDIRALREGEAGDALWDENVILTKKGPPLRAPNTEGSISSQDAQNPYAHIAQGFASTLLSSPHSALPLSRTRIHVRSFSITPIDASPAVLAGAASVILRRALQRAGLGSLMEPYVRLKVVVGEEHIGRVIKDLTEHGGETGGSSDGDEGWMSPSALSESGSGNMGTSIKRAIHAVAPLSQMLDFNNRLRALSGGHGTFEMATEGFRAVSEPRKMEILREIGRI